MHITLLLFKFARILIRKKTIGQILKTNLYSLILTMKIQSITQKRYYIKMLKLLYSNLLLLVPFLLVASCWEGCNQDTSSMTASNLNKPIVVVANGIDMTTDYLRSSMQQLSEDAKDIIYLKSVTGSKTRELSMQQQIQESWNELQELLRGIPDADARPLVLIGHSQGGVRLAGVALECEQKDLQVSLVTLNTVFEGAPGLRFKNKEELFKFCASQIEKSDAWPVQFKELGQSLAEIILMPLVEMFFQKDGQVSQQPGIQDLIPGSPFLEELSEKLKKSHFPILAIAGEAHVEEYIDFFSSFFEGLLVPLKIYTKASLDVRLEQLKNIPGIGSAIAPFVDERNSPDFRYKKELYTFCDFLTLTDRISRERIRKALFDIYKIVVSGDVNNSDSGHDLVIPISTQLGKTVLANRQNYKTHILHKALHIDPFYIKPEWKEHVENGISFLASLNPRFQELLPYQGTYQFPETIDNIKKFAAQQRSKARSTK